MKTAIISGVQFPIDLDDDFVTPMWVKLEEFYPTYKEKAQSDALSFVGYFNLICKLLEQHNRRDRSAERWKERYIEHFGASRLEEMIRKYDSIVSEDQAVS